MKIIMKMREKLRNVNIFDGHAKFPDGFFRKIALLEFGVFRKISSNYRLRQTKNFNFQNNAFVYKIHFHQIS